MFQRLWRLDEALAVGGERPRRARPARVEPLGRQPRHRPLAEALAAPRRPHLPPHRDLLHRVGRHLLQGRGQRRPQPLQEAQLHLAGARGHRAGRLRELERAEHLRVQVEHQAGREGPQLGDHDVVAVLGDLRGVDVDRQLGARQPAARRSAAILAA